MVNAGFIFTGILDKVKCFHCGVCLVDWKPDDVPLVEHKKHSDYCAYIAHLENIASLKKMGYSYEKIEPALTTTNLLEVISIICETDSTEHCASTPENLLCKICMDSPIDIIFIPCGHMVTCNKCAQTIKQCCMCRQNITQRIQTH
jgi:hypothetical protein